jgi:hypothetical protein
MQLAWPMKRGAALDHRLSSGTDIRRNSTTSYLPAANRGFTAGPGVAGITAGEPDSVPGRSNPAPCRCSTDTARCPAFRQRGGKPDSWEPDTVCNGSSPIQSRIGNDRILHSIHHRGRFLHNRRSPFPTGIVLEQPGSANNPGLLSLAFDCCSNRYTSTGQRPLPPTKPSCASFSPKSAVE